MAPQGVVGARQTATPAPTPTPAPATSAPAPEPVSPAADADGHLLASTDGGASWVVADAEHPVPIVFPAPLTPHATQAVPFELYNPFDAPIAVEIQTGVTGTTATVPSFAVTGVGGELAPGVTNATAALATPDWSALDEDWLGSHAEFTIHVAATKDDPAALASTGVDALPIGAIGIGILAAAAALLAIAAVRRRRSRRTTHPNGASS